MQFKLQFDVPYDFCVTPGLIHGVHSVDFKPKPDSFSDTWRDSLTGLVTLRPSFVNADFYNSMLPISALSYNTAFWQSVQRDISAQDNYISNVQPSNGSLMTSIIDVAIPLIESAHLASNDSLVWGTQTNISLGCDQPFVLHLHCIADELNRKSNLFALQWDNILIHFSTQGIMRTFQYDPANMQASPVLFHEAQIGRGGDFVNKTAYFIFFPIPTYGLAVYALQSSPALSVNRRSVDMGTAEGVLIPWPSSQDANMTSWYMFNSSPVALAVNPWLKYVIGYEYVTFPSSGTYADAVFDPGFTPVTSPTIGPDMIPTLMGGQTATSVFMSAQDPTQPYNPTLRQGRCVTTLDAPPENPIQNTPFLQGLRFEWDPIMASRATTATEPDRLLKLEYTHDELNHYEGEATIMVWTDAMMRIANRGDTTFLLQSSPDGVTWTTVYGGLAKKWRNTLQHSVNGSWMECQVKLFDMCERLREMHATIAAPLDGKTLPDAMNSILTGAGFPSINFSFPQYQGLDWLTETIPMAPSAKGETWRFSPRLTDNGDAMMKKLMIFLRRQFEEWVYYFDWDAQTWVVMQKPYSATLQGQFTPTSATADPASNIWYYGDGAKITPMPPEGNIVETAGLTTADVRGMRVQSDPIVNVPSITDPASWDYLGRYVLIFALIPEFPPGPKNNGQYSTKGLLNRLARAIYDASARLDIQVNITLPEPAWGLTPNMSMGITDAEGYSFLGSALPGFVKRITTVSDCDNFETMKVELSSIFFSDIGGDK